jgi:hypothetical protein
LEHVLQFALGLKKNFCPLAAHNGAIAATNAALIDYFGLAIFNSDGFNRAFLNTGVAHPAPVFYGKYQLFAP